MNAATKLAAAQRIKASWTVGGVANTVTDYLPFIGAAKDIGRGVNSLAHGRWGEGAGQLAMGAGFGALDLFTGGLGSTAARGIGKLGLRGAMSAGGHALAEAGVKGVAQAGGKAIAKAAPMTVGLGLTANAMTPQQPQPAPAPTGLDSLQPPSYAMPAQPPMWQAPPQQPMWQMPRQSPFSLPRNPGWQPVPQGGSPWYAG